MGPAPRDGIVRVQLASGHWLLERIEGTTTRVVYELLTDPGGFIPAWMVNVAQRYGMPDTLEAFGKRALDPTWRK